MKVDNFLISEELIVSVDISAIIIGGEESLTSLECVDGFSFEKIYLRDFRYRDQILMSNGKVNQNYYLSQLQEDKNNVENSMFIILKKTANINVRRPEIKGVYYITDKDDELPELDVYTNEQYDKISRLISKLNLLSIENIGVYEVFYQYSYNFLFNSTKNVKIVNSDANTLVKQKFEFDLANVEVYNRFLSNNNEAYELINHAIKQYSYANRLLDHAVRFEKLITTLEMIFLASGQRNKKETLAKRISIFLGNNDAEIRDIYDSMKLFYRYRSNSTHEGITDDIDELELKKLNELTRNSLLNYLDVINTELNNNPTVSFEEVKISLINDLKNKVTAKITEGILPV